MFELQINLVFSFVLSSYIIAYTEKLTPVLTFQKLPPSRNSRPVTAVVGQDLMIETVATAKVKPTVIWSKEGLNTLPAERFSRIGEGNLRIKSVRKSDTGYYRITARSGDEVSNHFINLVVQGKHCIKKTSIQEDNGIFTCGGRGTEYVFGRIMASECLLPDWNIQEYCIAIFSLHSANCRWWHVFMIV